MVKKIIVLLVFLCSASILVAGDIATFVNCGFSSNSRYYMFALYGIDDKSSPYAETYIVNVPANDFVPGGARRALYNEPVQPGQEGLGAFLMLFKDVIPITKQYSINHMKTGRILYLLLNGEEPKANLEFRDFNTGNRYDVSLNQSQYGSGSSVSASFFIDVTINFADGTYKDYTVGRPNYKRKGVLSYQISQVILSPDEESLVFIVEKEEQDHDGVNIRYMVETVKIR